MDYSNNQIRQRCENCNTLYLPRSLGDLADFNHLCQSCAIECATQLEIDYNLPRGCSDEERIAAINPHPPGTSILVFECNNPPCHRYQRSWSTHHSYSDWNRLYGRQPHCFACGASALLIYDYIQE